MSTINDEVAVSSARATGGSMYVGRPAIAATSPSKSSQLQVGKDVAGILPA
jgi:hypothetical protein